MPEFPIPSARILLVSQIQGGQLPPPAPLSGTPMVQLFHLLQIFSIIMCTTHWTQLRMQFPTRFKTQFENNMPSDCVKHLLIDLTDFISARERCFRFDTLTELFDNADSENIIDFNDQLLILAWYPRFYTHFIISD